MKTEISEEEFRQALRIDYRFEWPDGDFEFWIVWDTVRYLVREHFGDERLIACENSGKVGDEVTNAAWHRGLELAEKRMKKGRQPKASTSRRLAYRVGQAHK